MLHYMCIVSAIFMEHSDVVRSIAESEAFRFRKIQSFRDSDRIPLFEINADRKALPVVESARGHDNEDRLSQICTILNDSIIPLIDPACHLRGFYRIELHDSYSYLPNSHTYSNVLSFGRSSTSQKPHSVALFPDPYHMGSFGGLLDHVRMCETRSPSWEERSNRMLFAGASTGHRDPTFNSRVQAC